jgi:hypothetical protein
MLQELLSSLTRRVSFGEPASSTASGMLTDLVVYNYRDALDATMNYGAHSKFVAKWLDKLDAEDAAEAAPASAVSTAETAQPETTTVAATETAIAEAPEVEATAVPAMDTSKVVK